MCTRVLYETGSGTFITGRGMDWNDPDASTSIWAFPKQMKRDGGIGANPFGWVSRYGSVVACFYNSASADGMNEAGLVANALYLAEADYGDAAKTGKPTLSVGAWVQYFLDSYATVAEAVAGMADPPFVIVGPLLQNGRPASVHLSLSDPSGDSAILEYVNGALTIHHGNECRVMTNSPTYDQQIAINTYWELVGGNRMLPGTINAADRYVRASYFLKSSPKYADPIMAVASVFSQMRSIGVPLGMADPDHPNISATLWRTIADHHTRRYYFDSSVRPTVFWVDLEKLDLSPEGQVMMLDTLAPSPLSGEVSSCMKPADPFVFLTM